MGNQNQRGPLEQVPSDFGQQTCGTHGLPLTGLLKLRKPTSHQQVSIYHKGGWTAPPEYFQSLQIKTAYNLSSHQNSQTSPSLGNKMWEDHDPRGRGCRHEEAFSLKVFIKWITWTSLTALGSSQVSKKLKLQSWKSNFVSPLEKHFPISGYWTNIVNILAVLSFIHFQNSVTE